MTERGSDPDTLDKLRRERDLYAGLLNLNLESDPEPFLKSALELISSVVGAECGCLELFGSDDMRSGWFHSTGFSVEEIGDVRATISRGIIAEAVASGRVVLTPSAVLDPRFRDRASVQRAKTDAVLCAPIGRDPPRGVLYLQGRMPGGFDRDSIPPVEIFARHLAPLVREFEQRRRYAGKDRVAELRAKLIATDLIGRSRALGDLLHEVELVAPLDVGVLIYGDNGTGKTQLARIIHRNSPRASGPFVELNCATLPPELAENELFGSAQGAHSTATRRIEGKIAAAENGTLFLDEIGDLHTGAQAKLLQFLQSKTYCALGSTRTVTADTRILAATRFDLEQEVAANRFREDLFYRLQVMTIRVPSLSERVDDIPILARYFCERAFRKHKLPNVELSPGAIRALEAAEWPGNVRQLAYSVERATIRVASERMQRIEASHIFPDHAVSRDSSEPLTYQSETRRFQEQLVKRSLLAEDWNISATARRLDLTRTHLYNLIKSFGLKDQSSDGLGRARETR
jgi:Nif-specific regulatory protein